MFRGGRKLAGFLFSTLKIFFLLSTALFLPRLFVFYSKNKTASSNSCCDGSFKLGLEQITPALLNKLKIDSAYLKSIVLITNETGVDQLGNQNVKILESLGFTIKALLVPNMVDITSFKASFNARITTYCFPISKKTSQELCENLDFIVFDIQDVSSNASYIQTILQTLEMVHEFNKPLVILDRPNLFGPFIERMPKIDLLINPTLFIPSRHGMTVGELAHYCNDELFNNEIDLHVIPMKSYNRHVFGPECNLEQLLPNFNQWNGLTFLAALKQVYPFNVEVDVNKKIETISLSQKTGIQDKHWYKLMSVLKQYGISSNIYHSTRDNEHYSGLKIFVADTDNFSSFGALITILDFFKQRGLSLYFSDKFDESIGTSNVRKFVMGQVRRKKLENEINNELQRFYNKASKSFLYKPLPKVVMI